MGYMQGSQTRSKYKNTDTTQNHVDRVRVPDTNYEFGGPGRGSGWRHRSLSNIDLTSQSKHSFTKQTRGYTSGLYDLYSRLEAKKDPSDTENLYGNVNTTNVVEKVESIYDRIEQTLDTLNDSESCSLRRTRSLAVIREETFNDLQIGGGIRTRRSQLIPRAKLLNRSFFQNRNTTKKKYRGEDDSGSGVDTQTSETRESDDYYGNLKNIHGSQIIQQALGDQKLLPALWLNDKSDLDSLDSDYFKNSLHQFDGSGAGVISGSSPHKERVIIETNGELVDNFPEILINDSYIDDNLSIKSGNLSIIPDYCTINPDEIIGTENYANSAENVTILHTNSNNLYAVNSGTLTICRSSRHNSESEDGETAERRLKFKEDHRSVISYDSIYLSSEGSNDPTTIVQEEEKINEYLSDNNYSTLSEYTNNKSEIVIEPHANPDSEQIECDDLYSQINKSKNKPKIVLLEPKTKLTTFSDITSRGTLERLTFVSSPAAIHKEYTNNKVAQKPLLTREPTAENQYCSLPLANIGKSLQASERIDAKLRLSCIPLNEQTQIYNSITNFGRSHKKLRQRECFDIVVVNPSISIEEKPKELPSINIRPKIRELQPEAIVKSKVESAGKLLKIDEEISSLISTELTDIENSSSKDCQIDEIRQRPEKIKLKEKSKPLEQPKLPVIQITESRDNIIEETIDIPTVKINENPVRHKSYQKSHHSKRQISGKGGDKSNENNSGSGIKNNLSNTLKRRIENKSKHNLNEKPILKFVRNIDKSKNSKHSKVQQAILENINSIAKPNFSMSRPQILNVIDSKRSGAQKSSATNNRSNKKSEKTNGSTVATAHAHKEFQHKVDSVRNYWSKLIDDTDDGKENEKYTFAGDSEAVEQFNATTPTPANNSDEIVVRAATMTASNNTLKRAASAGANMRSLLRPERDELNSFTPSVEIVELEDQKQAAIVKVQEMDTQDFDHVRYKVIKSDTFQKNILTQSRKEAQFDGLLQYLHDYSFQELLTQNNVVIIEPIRTKIEQISNKPHDSQILACKITAGAGRLSDGKGNLKKHFFYHPIRVNKELLDEELPTPDTVRNAKKLFEETLLFRSMKTNSERGGGSMIGLNETCKNSDRKYLTLETFNGAGGRSRGTVNNGTDGNNGNVCSRIKKWDSSSLSSGISSGDLSSPCDCNENDDNKLMSNESGNELCESYYVSQDILEKIRECGSSVTYYGGRVLNNQSPDVSPMTKAIMREIRSEDNICEVCQPNNCPHSSKLFTSFCDADNNHLGVKLRLIKSNSCNSRLELTGTQFDVNRDRLNKTYSRNRSVSHLEHEDTVRNIIQRIESNQIHEKRMPRIIESKCIEKMNGECKAKDKLLSQQKEIFLAGLTKSSAERLGPLDILSQVSVKNHINSSGLASINENPSKSSVLPRNKNVDLAIDINKLIVSKTSKEMANKTTKKETKPLIEQKTGKVQSIAPKLAGVRPTALSKIDIQDKLIKDNHKAIMQDICKAVARSDEDKNTVNNKSRLVKWETLSAFDEKNYLANDVAIKLKPKYDEIEFEEFEVIEPNN